MSSIMRTWLAFSAIGAGMIHLALVISSPLPLAIGLALLGLAEFGWGIMLFARDRLLAPAAARAAALTPIVLWSLLVVISVLFENPGIAAPLTFAPMAIASVFDLFIAAVLTLHLRRIAADTVIERPAPAAWRYLGGLAVGAVAVSFMVTPALAATEAGAFAQPHGQHDANFVPETGDDSPLVLPEHAGH